MNLVLCEKNLSDCFSTMVRKVFFDFVDMSSDALNSVFLLACFLSSPTLSISLCKQESHVSQQKVNILLTLPDFLF